MAEAPNEVALDANKKSYRTKGKTINNGQLLRGNVRSISGYRSSSSIPSKFETVLHDGNKERNAFNCRIYRFNENENELPGVGKYSIQQGPSGCELEKHGASVSQRGMGAMISKDFTNKSFTWNDIKAAVPGPGSYRPQDMMDKSWKHKEDKCLFAGRNGNSFYDSDATPAPGDYNPHQPLGSDSSTSRLASCKASFNSRAIRLKDKRSKAPAPGTYQVDKKPFNKLEYGIVCPSSAFCSGVERKKVAEVVAKKNSSLPGPSSYDSTQAHLLGLHGAGCHMFTGKIARAPFALADPEVIEACQKAKYDGNPGPGAYFDPNQAHSINPKKLARKAPCTGSFKSSSARIDYMVIKQNPGPSHYKTPTVGKPLTKSFHLNTTGSWV